MHWLLKFTCIRLVSKKPETWPGKLSPRSNYRQNNFQVKTITTLVWELWKLSWLQLVTWKESCSTIRKMSYVWEPWWMSTFQNSLSTTSLSSLQSHPIFSLPPNCPKSITGNFNNLWSIIVYLKIFNQKEDSWASAFNFLIQLTSDMVWWWSVQLSQEKVKSLKCWLKVCRQWPDGKTLSKLPNWNSIPNQSLLINCMVSSIQTQRAGRMVSLPSLWENVLNKPKLKNVNGSYLTVQSTQFGLKTWTLSSMTTRNFVWLQVKLSSLQAGWQWCSKSKTCPKPHLPQSRDAAWSSWKRNSWDGLLW